ncbi:MAG: antitoxin [Prosthecobacter sp.]|jgi:hypothetical protein|uniref:hypothetical protein n=1 Tax=Prosthecobacter sp. TaxID=1965333 RepID=UPI0019FE9993|nr:hypothetical protein [Prosthecobacter sp.]MBE2283358.1 antitoxin [Prosthecobacter sp.]
MKTTLELPGDLVREVKLRAVHEGRKLKDTVADLLRRGLAARKTNRAPKSSRVKLPLIQCRKAAVLTPEQVSEILNGQEAEWHHEAA